MSETNSSNKSEAWSQYAKHYNPLKIGSIDGTDTEPHDKAIVRAIDSDYIPNKFVKGRPECTIFVSRLNPKTTKDTIKEIFSKFGQLKRFRLVRDIVTGFPKGYAFIEYESESSAEEAYRSAYRMNIDGNVVFVDFECERLLKGWKPRRLGGGFGGKKESGQLRFGGRDRPFRKPIHLEIREREEKSRTGRFRQRSYDSDEERRKRRRSRSGERRRDRERSYR
ncbi:U11/U12 small nuclear ribonucleoprotein 35 kDa protein-like [Onthophagus taurus]|uniref:U11/U12 small nuclear ribonucleoprotein 35 kDa protein-like n=1 Tax=Onthophagus taurus TaxID=166361 RepID=UPI000C200DE3|nr:U11/U12 small nuclear ribonucleoprotein 35 kDa protein-like [Onthophagus taurus]